MELYAWTNASTDFWHRQGYTLSWMSQHGFFPLENIVHIDPDAFKMMMPEWPDYVARDRDNAGTMCHMESCFMVEAGAGGHGFQGYSIVATVVNGLASEKHIGSFQGG